MSVVKSMPANRRAVLGAPYVDNALAKATPFTVPLQALVTRHAWGHGALSDGAMRLRRLRNVGRMPDGRRLRCGPP
jgi:alkylhydroperoxidase/carboxymuconolactone decarboxylase family protein YurZ